MLIKIAILLALLLFPPAFRVYADQQTGSARFNPTLNRMEYFNNRSRLSGFSRYNPFLNRTEYFD